MNITLTTDILKTLETASERLIAADTALKNGDKEVYERASYSFSLYAAGLIGMLTASVKAWQREAEAKPTVLELKAARQAGYDAMYPYWRSTWDGECAIAPECPYSDPYLIAEWRKGSGEAARAVGYPF